MAKISEVMSTDLILVQPSTSVAEAATMMGGRHAGSALVMEGQRLAGIFTERDIVRALGEHFDAAGHQVSNWMTPRPRTIGPDDTTDAALDMMLTGGFRHLPVVEGDRVLGIVSIRDLARAES